MKRLLTMCAALGASLLATSFALAAEPQVAQAETNDGQPVYMRGTMAAYFADADKPKEGDAKKEEKPMKEEKAAAAPSCGSSSCGSDAPSCSSDTPECGSACGAGGGTCFCPNWGTLCCVDNCWPFCCCCKPGDPCTLQKELTPCCKDVTYGGWFAFGFYTNNDPLSSTQQRS